MNVWTGLYTVCLVLPLSCSIQFRYVYTLFETRKTWNEAKQICEDQQGQLVKAGNSSANDKILNELTYLDNKLWNNAIGSGDGIWNGLHQSSIGDPMWKYQDCEEYGDQNFTKVTLPGTPTSCSISDNTYDLHEVACNETHQFVCQRYLGDCWFERIDGEDIPITNNINIAATDPSDCALICNNHTDSTNDCWAFQFFPSIDLCMLEYHSLSTFFIDDLNRNTADDPDLQELYVRRCFEGLVDSDSYPEYVNEDPLPDSNCDNKTYDGGPQGQPVCFCTTEDKPPIPEPISNEDKIEQLIKELTLDTSNTSSAVRKLISAEDNRPSAVGVGFIGVGLLTAVFGTLFLLDMGRFVRGVRALFRPSGESTA